MVKEKSAPAPQLDKENVEIGAAVSLSGLSFSECEACRKQAGGLLFEFKPYIRMGVVLLKGVKILAPHYGPEMMLCYPCLKRAVKIDVRKK